MVILYRFIVLTNLIPGDLQLNENEHLHFSKFVGSPFLCTTGLCHDGTGPVSMPTAEPTGSVATGTGFLDGAWTESIRKLSGLCGRPWKVVVTGLYGSVVGKGSGRSYGGLLKVSETWIGCWSNGSLSGT